jgi:hypothetical protein
MTGPTIDPITIGDQCGADDFVIEAAIRDAETDISDAFVSYSWHSDPGNFPCYISTSLLPAEEDAWISSIPSVSALVGEEQEGCDPIDLSQPVRFYYYLCAWDSDDPNRDEEDPESKKCDNAWCEPNQSQFTFVWAPSCDGGGQPGGACPDDPHDEGAGNDNKETPADMGTDGGFSLVLCPGDEDWYAVDAQAGDTLVVGAAFSGENGELQVQAFGPDGSPAGQPPAEVEENYVLIEIPNAVEGVYVVAITGAGVGGGGEVYNFINRRDAGGGAAPGDCQSDAEEPNETADDATAVQPGASGPYGLCGPGDTQDWYSFEATAGDQIAVELQFAHRADGDLDLELWPPGGARRVARGFSTTDNESLEFTANADGAWTIGVIGYRGAVNTYRLELSVGGGGGGEEPGGEDGGGNDPPADPLCSTDQGAEPNNTTGEARVIDGPVACATVQEGDEDWWRVDLEALQGFTANVAFTDADGDIDVEVYAANSTTLLLAGTSVNDDETVSFPGAAAGGPVYLKVIGFGGAQNTYAISLNKQAFGLGPIARCGLDHQEPNDAREDARLLILRQDAVTRRALTWCGDDDWYRVRLPEGAGKALLGELVYDTGQAALIPELVDAEGNAVGEVSDLGNGTFEILSRHAGANYLRVSGADGPNGAGLYWFEFIVIFEI